MRQDSNDEKEKNPDDMPYFLTAQFKEIMEKSEEDNQI